MRSHVALSVSVLSVLVAAGTAQASWIFRPSYYSHDAQTGQRVAQYAQPAPSYSRVGTENYLQSGYRHNQTTLWAGEGGADHVHVVETWGQGDRIRPYGEWLFPYRAGATPYGPWGNPQGPWTTPFGSWVNPYGLMPRYAPMPPQAMQPMPNGMQQMPYGMQPMPQGMQQMPYGQATPPLPNQPRVD